jgi:hypothetical protein
MVYERFASPVISRRAKSLLKHLLEQLQVVQFSECYTRLVLLGDFLGAQNVFETSLHVLVCSYICVLTLLYICPHTTVYGFC